MRSLLRAKIGESRVQRFFQELGEGILMIDLAFYVAADFVKFAVAERLQDDVERKLQGAELLLLEFLVFIGAGRFLIDGRNFVGVELHQRILT